MAYPDPPDRDLAFWYGCVIAFIASAALVLAVGVIIWTAWVVIGRG